MSNPNRHIHFHNLTGNCIYMNTPGVILSSAFLAYENRGVLQWYFIRHAVEILK